MKKRFLLFSLMIIFLTAVIPSFADEELIWSNFNNDPVKNHPQYYGTFPIPDDHAPILVTRIRTFHWNSGYGAEPGRICAYEGSEEIRCWQAVGRSAYGTPNVYWEVLADLEMLPGHTYGFKVSDFDSWSYNEASQNRGMIELYGENHASGADNAPASGSTSAPAIRKNRQSFFLGRYEQDNDLGNGKEPIEWEVLTVQKDRELVISKYALDFRKYNDVFEDMTWETCSLRKWLNGDFYNNAFSDAEKNQILLVTNENPDNPVYGTDGGNLTQDRIFLLSYPETQWYFTSDADRVSGLTDYARANAQMVNSQSPYYTPNQAPRTEASWWLRTPGSNPGLALNVTTGGSVFLDGYSSPDMVGDNWCLDVRPAFWLKLAPAPKPTATPKPRTCYTVTYHGNNCLSKVPSDKKCYQPGDTVTVLFDPMEYMPGMIFYGWDRDGDGTADHGYYYNSFTMPAKNVNLNAICYAQIYDRQNYYPDITPDDRQQQYYDNQNVTGDYYNTGTGWWYDGGYDDFYDGVG